MAVAVENYEIAEETFLKACILTRGIVFSEKAISIANEEVAKRQNLVYNIPVNADNNRPQELILKGLRDGYETVVSCVAPNGNGKPVILSYDGDGLIAMVDGHKIENVTIHFVREPEYYRMLLDNNEPVKEYVSACGLDELNIIPWKGCAISRKCLFCGTNSLLPGNTVNAFSISKEPRIWENMKGKYLDCLAEAVGKAIKCREYNEHLHVILISGNLSNDMLDYEAEIFASIARRILPLVAAKSSEGIILVITPPSSTAILSELKESGISKVVFNLEAITGAGHRKYCPGKAELGMTYIHDRLISALDVFGKGNVWTNLVYGLEDNDDVLPLCEKLIKEGIVISANVLHLDKGNTLDRKVPELDDTVDFFYRLNKMNSSEGFRPFYCSKALRTSLTNEAFDRRIISR